MFLEQFLVPLRLNVFNGCPRKINGPWAEIRQVSTERGNCMWVWSHLRFRWNWGFKNMSLIHVCSWVIEMVSALSHHLHLISPSSVLTILLKPYTNRRLYRQYAIAEWETPELKPQRTSGEGKRIMEKFVIWLNHSLTSAKGVVCLDSAFGFG